MLPADRIERNAASIWRFVNATTQVLQQLNLFTTQRFAFNRYYIKTVDDDKNQN